MSCGESRGTAIRDLSGYEDEEADDTAKSLTVRSWRFWLAPWWRWRRATAGPSSAAFPWCSGACCWPSGQTGWLSCTPGRLAPARLFMTWTLQGLWVSLTVAAALAAITAEAEPDLGWWWIPGALLWVIGIALEVTADVQKSVFKADPANDGDYVSTGLWAWSRHPNYFGEIGGWRSPACRLRPGSGSSADAGTWVSNTACRHGGRTGSWRHYASPADCTRRWWAQMCSAPVSRSCSYVTRAWPIRCSRRGSSPTWSE